jgi:hypothetical protein
MAGAKGKSGGPNRKQGRKSNEEKSKEIVKKNKGGPLDHMFNRINSTQSQIQSNQLSDASEVDSSFHASSSQTARSAFSEAAETLPVNQLVDELVDILEDEKEEDFNVGLRDYLLNNSASNDCNITDDEEDCEEDDFEEKEEQNEEFCDFDGAHDDERSDSSHFLQSYFLKNKNALNIDVLKKRIAEGDVWIRALDPICRAYASNGINLDRFLAPDLYIFAPTLISDGIGRCICCNSSSLNLGGWAHNPIARRIYSFNRSYFVLAKILECRNCKKSFSSTNQQFISTLPYHIQLMIPFFLSHRAGIDKTFFFYLRSLMLEGTGPTTLRKIIREIHYLNYDLKRTMYYSLADELMQKRKLLNIAPLEVELFGEFDDKTKYNEKIVSATYISEQFIQHHEGVRPYYDSRMNMIPCSVGSFDDSFKAVKMIRYKSIKVFDALGSFFAESGEVIGQWLRYTKSLDEIEEDLKELLRPWRKIGIMYTDNECAEREVYERALGLRKGSSVVRYSRKLKPYSTNVKVILVESTLHLNNVCTGILSRNIRSIGLDCEWEVSFIPGCQSGKVALLQICDGATAFLCRMKKIGSIPCLLKNILESDSILKIGRNVRKDVTKLAEDYKCNLIPKGIIELGSFCKSVGYSNGRAGLSELAAAFLKRSLEKRDNIRLSNWEAESLSEEQKLYAAMDSSVSLEIFQKALLYKGSRLCLPFDPELVSKEVYVFPRTGFCVLAKGKLIRQCSKDLQKAVVEIYEVFVKEGKIDNISLSSAELPFTTEIYLNRLSLNKGFSYDFQDADDEIMEEEKSEEPVQFCKGDPFHVLDRMYVKKHVYRKHFFEMFREAMFIMDKTDLENVLKVNPGEEFRKRVLNKWLPYVQKRIRRYIPQPSVLFERLSSVYEFFKDKKDSKGILLLSKQNREDFLNILEHCKMGCLSDPENVELYQKVGSDKNGLNLYRCIRGTNKAETYHQKLIRRFSAFRASPRFADALLSESRHRYNSRIAVRIRKSYDACHYDQYFTEAIQLLTEKIYGRPLHPNWESSDWDFNVSTGVARQVKFPRHLLDQIASVTFTNKELNWLSKKTQMKIPILPMHTKEEHNLFVDLVSENKSIQEIQNVFCEKSNGINIFPKAIPQIERYIKKYKTFGKDALIFRSNLKDIRSLRDQLQEPIDLDVSSDDDDDDEMDEEITSEDVPVEDVPVDLDIHGDQNQDENNQTLSRSVLLPSTTMDTHPIQLIGTNVAQFDNSISTVSELRGRNDMDPVIASEIPGTIVVGQILHHASSEIPKRRARKSEVERRRKKRCKSTKNAPLGRTDMICGKEGCPGADNRNNCTNLEYVLVETVQRRRRSRERQTS